MSIGHWAIRGIHRIHVNWFNWLKLLTAGITSHIYLIAEPLNAIRTNETNCGIQTEKSLKEKESSAHASQKENAIFNLRWR